MLWSLSGGDRTEPNRSKPIVHVTQERDYFLCVCDMHGNIIINTILNVQIEPLFMGSHDMTVSSVVVYCSINFDAPKLLFRRN